MFRQQFERSIRVKPEMLSELLDVLAAQRRPKLIRRDRQVLAASKPGLHLGAEAALLQLSHHALQITQVRLCQHSRDESRHCRGLDLPQRALEPTAQIVKKSHGLLLGLRYAG